MTMNRCRTPTLIDVFGFDGELCQYWGLGELDVPPWNGTALEVSTTYIDQLLFTNFGERPINAYLQHYIDDTGHISAANAQKVARFVMAMCRNQWERLTADYTAEYNPIENYNMHEEENTTDEASGTDTETQSYDQYKETQTYDHTITSENVAYPADSTTPHHTDTNTTTTGAADDTGDQFTKTGEQIREFEHGKTNEIDRTLDRAGNIGVQTATDMLRSDEEFWSTHNFYMRVCADIAALLTVPIYE